MNLIDNLKENIKKNEGWSSIAYTDSLGFKTIGYGFKLSELDTNYSTMNKEEAESILDDKVIKLITSASKKFEWLLYQPKTIRLVIYEIIYQIGLTGFSKFKKTIKFLKNKEYVKAAFELLDSKLAEQAYKRTLNHAKNIAYTELNKKKLLEDNF